jgi:acyl-coenzyme A thioesterase PaaI-like protein
MLAAATTSVPESDLAEAQQLAARACEVLERTRRDQGVRVNMDRAAITRVREGMPWKVFRHNPLGIPLVIHVSEDVATATVQPSALFEGPPRLLHGGFSAAMMDALLSTLVQAQELRAVTVRLEVELLAAVTLDAPLHLEARIDSVEGRKVVARGTMHREGVEVVRGTALLITIPGDPD